MLPGKVILGLPSNQKFWKSLKWSKRVIKIIGEAGTRNKKSHGKFIMRAWTRLEAAH